MHVVLVYSKNICIFYIYYNAARASLLIIIIH